MWYCSAHRTRRDYGFRRGITSFSFSAAHSCSWSCLVEDVPDRLLMQEMCDIALRMEPWSLRIIPDYFKSQEICDEAAARHPYMLENVPDWFVRKQQIRPWDDDYHDELIKWYKGYQKRKAQRSQIKKELMRIAWHPSRWWDWCVPDDVKT